MSESIERNTTRGREQTPISGSTGSDEDNYQNGTTPLVFRREGNKDAKG